MRAGKNALVALEQAAGEEWQLSVRLLHQQDATVLSSDDHLDPDCVTRAEPTDERTANAARQPSEGADDRSRRHGWRLPGGYGEPVRSLNQLGRVRIGVQRVKWLYYTRVWHMDIDSSVLFSLKANFDRTYPRGVHVGANTYVAFRAVVLTHDRTRGLYLHTRIGENCFIGAHSMILPGVTVGDGSVVGAGSVVTKDVAPRTAVAGNPAQVVRSDIEVGAYGRFSHADANEARLRASGELD